MITKINVFISENVDNSLPLKKLKCVYHVGTLDISKKRQYSLEGAGLSVSLHPHEWMRITKNMSGDIWQLKNSEGLFVDAYKIKKDTRNSIIQWGVDNGYIKYITTYRVYRSGGYMEFDTFEKAKEEAQDDFPIRKNNKGIIHTDKLVHITKQINIDPVDVYDLLLTVYVESETSYDGVWWNDYLDVYNYSAPRGVIFNSRMNKWKVGLFEKL